MPSGALTKNLSFNDFKIKYAGHRSPLLARGTGSQHDVVSPGFTDWLLHLSEDLSPHAFVNDSSKSDTSVADGIDELRKEE